MDMRDRIKATKPDTTEEEWQKIRKSIEDDAQLYALYEAGPEIVGNMLTAGIIKTPVGSLIAKIPLIKNGIARALANAGVKVGLAAPMEVGIPRKVHHAGRSNEARKIFEVRYWSRITR